MKKLPWCHDTDAKLAGLWPKIFLIGRDDGHRIANALAIHGQLQHLMIVVSTYVPSLLSRHAYVMGQLERGDGALGVDVLSAALGLAEIHRELGGLAAMQVVLFNRYFIALLSTLAVKLTEFKTCMGFILEASSRHLIFHGAVVLVATGLSV